MSQIPELTKFHVEIDLLFLKYQELKEKIANHFTTTFLNAQHEAIELLLKEEDIILNEIAEQEHELITNSLVEFENTY